jgi:hypothetical protein
MKKFGIFYGHLVYITAIWSILWPFSNLVAIWFILPRFGILCLFNVHKMRVGNALSVGHFICARLHGDFKRMVELNRRAEKRMHFLNDVLKYSCQR